MTNSNQEFIARWSAVMHNNYGTPAIALSHGSGAEIWDVEGKRYVDLLGGIATTILGHNNPEIVNAIHSQSQKLSHISNFYIHEPGVRLAERLISFTGNSQARVFFSNSGAEANEAAIKISRLTGRFRIHAFKGAFHGRTMGALSLTGQPAKQKRFLPLLPGVTHSEYGDIKALKRAITKKTAMVIVEPIMGESGVITPTNDFLQAIQDRCLETGSLLAVDAVQTGMGRTGTWFGYEKAGLQPDIITLAKGLGGGLALGATISMNRAPRFEPGDHGSTFGGNPIATAAANAAVDVIERDGLMKRADELGEWAQSRIASAIGVAQIRGKGLLIGIELQGRSAREVATEAMRFGLLVNSTSDTVIRLAPPLSITSEQFTSSVELLLEIIEKSGESRGNHSEN